MLVKGIIFDLDGTLVDSIADLGDAANTMFVKYGYPSYKREDFIRWIGNGAAKFIQNGIGSVIDTEALQDYVAEFKEIYYNNLAKKTRLYEGVDKLLDELTKRRIKMSILSNKPDLHTRKVVDHYLNAWSFISVCGQKDGIPRKPDPGSSLQMAFEMGLDPGNILFIGDSQGDIKTALAAGMHPVWVSWGYGDPETAFKNQSETVNDPEKILSLLK